MKITREDFLMKLQLVNEGLDKQGLQRFGYNYTTKGRGSYCLMKFAMKDGKMSWVECTDYMSLINLWHFLDGMFTLLIMEGNA